MVSAIGDDYTSRFPQIWPTQPWLSTPVSRSEFDALRAEVEKMKKDLVEAKRQDIENNEPDCEQEEKVDLLKKIAEYVGVSLEEVFPSS